MVHKNYIILAHKNPEQLWRLIERLNDGYSFFYVHVDLKSDINLFTRVNKENVKFVNKRINCIWGDFSQVLATLNCIDEILKDQKDGYTILLSAQDYPIKSNAFINDYLKQYAGFDHISMEISPIPEDDQMFYINRLINIKINLTSNRGDFLLLPYYWRLKLRSKISYLLLILRKKAFDKDVFKMFIKRKKPFKEFSLGPQWWGLTFNTLKKTSAFIKKNKAELFDYYKNVLNGEECFFHSIIKELMKDDGSILLRNCLTYIDWNPRPQTSLPVTFDITDITTLLKQPYDKLFARKFDMEFDNEILDALDTQIA